MKRAISKHLVDFVAILVLLVIALGVAGFVLTNQRLYAPGWVPLIGKDFFTLKAEFQTAQAVSPGQGQTVDIAGVKVGEISNVELKNGRAVVTMKIQPKYAEGKDGRPAIYRDAQMLLRPKTGLKDMIIEMTPGTPKAGKVKDGETIPVGQTLPDINFDEVLASLDADSRRYLVVLLNGASQGLDKNGANLSDTLRRFEPTARDGERLTSQLQVRGQNLRRVISNFRKLSEALAGKDDQLSQFVDANNAVFQSFAAQEANIRATLQELPPSLTQTQSTLAKVNTLANALGPAFQALRPGARALAPAQLAIRPFVTKATPIIRDQIRPFTRLAQPIVQELRPAARDLTALTPDLVQTFKVLNYAVNELGYNPSGSEEGFLYWLGWLPHVLGGLYTTGDTHGTIRRGEILLSCTSLALVEGVGAGIPAVGLISGLSHIPTLAEVCKPPAGAAARKATPGSGKDKPDESGLGPAGEGPNASGGNAQGTGSGATGQGTGSGANGQGTTTQPRTQSPVLTDKPAPSAAAPSPRESASSTTPASGGGR